MYTYSTCTVHNYGTPLIVSVSHWILSISSPRCFSRLNKSEEVALRILSWNRLVPRLVFRGERQLQFRRGKLNRGSGRPKQKWVSTTAVWVVVQTTQVLLIKNCHSTNFLWTEFLGKYGSTKSGFTLQWISRQDELKWNLLFTYNIHIKSGPLTFTRQFIKPRKGSRNGIFII